MNEETLKKTVEYWRRTAEHDYKTMEFLFQSKRYSDALFFGHIILEKILKGLVVAHTKKEAPYIHNLVRLAQSTGLDFDENTIDLLAEINRFNIRARYPDYKMEFYKKCTQSYTKEYLKKIKALYKDLCQTLKNKH